MYIYIYISTIYLYLYVCEYIMFVFIFPCIHIFLYMYIHMRIMRDATLTWTVFYFLLDRLLFECFVIFWFFGSDLVLSFHSLLKLSGYAFLVKCWQCSIWPGFVCQVQMWSMIENYDCAWNSYLYEFDFACA